MKRFLKLLCCLIISLPGLSNSASMTGAVCAALLSSIGPTEPVSPENLESHFQDFFRTVSMGRNRRDNGYATSMVDRRSQRFFLSHSSREALQEYGRMRETVHQLVQDFQDGIEDQAGPVSVVGYYLEGQDEIQAFLDATNKLAADLDQIIRPAVERRHPAYGIPNAAKLAALGVLMSTTIQSGISASIEGMPFFLAGLVASYFGYQKWFRPITSEIPGLRFFEPQAGTFRDLHFDRFSSRVSEKLMQRGTTWVVYQGPQREMKATYFNNAIAAGSQLRNWDLNEVYMDSVNDRYSRSLEDLLRYLSLLSKERLPFREPTVLENFESAWYRGHEDMDLDVDTAAASGRRYESEMDLARSQRWVQTYQISLLFHRRINEEPRLIIALRSVKVPPPPSSPNLDR